MINLNRHTEKLKMAFGSLVYDLEMHLTKQKKRTEVVVHCLKFIERSYFSDCTSISDVFNELAKYFSFFDYEIIKFLIRKFGSVSNKEKLRKYKNMFCEYSKRRIVECPEDAFGGACESEKVWVLKTDRSLETLTAREVKTLQYEVNKILPSSHKIVRLLNVEEGCVKLTYRGFGEDNLKISGLQQQAFRKAGVLSIFYGDQCEDFSKRVECESGKTL